MKRILLLFVFAIASTAFAGEQAEKRQLVSELLEVVDAKAMLQASFVNFLTALGSTTRDHGAPELLEDIPEEYRKAWEEERRAEEKKMREFQERLFARIDYTKYFDDVYVPLLDREFTPGELREIIAFFRTKHGQKLAKMLPEFGINATGIESIKAAGEATEREMAKEKAAKYPWRATMSNMRSIATAAEAYATDTNEYPRVEFEDLERVLAPTYIREIPKVDSWGTPYLYVSDGKEYRLVSAGADKRFEFGARQLQPPGPEPIRSENLDADIIFQNGEFIQSPNEPRTSSAARTP